MTKIPQGRSAYVSLFLFVVLLGARTSAADTLTLTWDFNSEPEVEGYRVYVGTQSGVYSQTIDVHNTNSYVFPNVVPGQRYCFAVLAYAGSIVSPLSQEACGSSNDYPTISSPGTQSGRVGVGISLQLSASDPDGAPLAYSASGLPSGLTISSNLGTITGTPTAAGTYSVTTWASDGVLAAQQSFQWSIQPPLQNVAPTLVNPGSQTGEVGRQVLLQLQGADANADVLTYSATGLPPGLQVTAATGQIAGALAIAGTYNVTATVSDGQLNASTMFVWTVTSGTTDSGSGSSTATSRGRKNGWEPKYKGTAALLRPEEEIVQTTTTARVMTGTQATPRQTASEPAHDYTGAAISRQPASTSGTATTTHSAVTRAILRGANTAATPDGDTGSAGLVTGAGAPTTAMTSDRSPRSAVTTPAAAPQVTIDTPINREIFAGGSVVIFMGSARDALGANLTDAIVWTSSRDGRLGTGGLLHKALTPGTHLITASVTDSLGAKRSAHVTIVVSK